MNIKFLAAAFCLLPLALHAADTQPKPANNNMPAEQTRAAATQPGVAPGSSDEFMKSFWQLAGMRIEFDKTIAPLGTYYVPFSSWAHSTRAELQGILENIQAAKTPAEGLSRAAKAKPQFEKSLKIAQSIVPIDKDVHDLKNSMKYAADCLAKRQAALQQAEAKVNSAVATAMNGLPVSVTSLNSLVADAKAACS